MASRRCLLAACAGRSSSARPSFVLPSLPSTMASSVLLSPSNTLVSHGADVNVRMSNGATPLFIAKGEGHLDVVNALLRHGAMN